MEYKAKKDLEVVPFPLESAVTKVLKKGRSRIEQGWGQRKLLDKYGNYCIVGAIDYIDDLGYAPDGRPSHAAGMLLALAADLNLSLGKGLVGPLASWNDTPSRKKEEVLQVFDRAIVKSMEGDNAI